VLVPHIIPQVPHTLWIPGVTTYYRYSHLTIIPPLDVWYPLVSPFGWYSWYHVMASSVHVPLHTTYLLLPYCVYCTASTAHVYMQCIGAPTCATPVGGPTTCSPEMVLPVLVPHTIPQVPPLSGYMVLLHITGIHTLHYPTTRCMVSPGEPLWMVQLVSCNGIISACATTHYVSTLPYCVYCTASTAHVYMDALVLPPVLPL
jgi:hypothetical protein